MRNRSTTRREAIEEAVDAWADEAQDEYDARMDEEMLRDLRGLPELGTASDEVMAQFDAVADSGLVEFFVDGNSHGVVYYCPLGAREACFKALVEGGGAPFRKWPREARSFVYRGLRNVDGSEPWELRAAPAWWYLDECPDDEG